MDNNTAFWMQLFKAQNDWQQGEVQQPPAATPLIGPFVQANYPHGFMTQAPPPLSSATIQQHNPGFLPMAPSLAPSLTTPSAAPWTTPLVQTASNRGSMVQTAPPPSATIEQHDAGIQPLGDNGNLDLEEMTDPSDFPDFSEEDDFGSLPMGRAIAQPQPDLSMPSEEVVLPPVAQTVPPTGPFAHLQHMGTRHPAFNERANPPLALTGQSQRMETQHSGDMEQAASTTRVPQTRLPATRPVRMPNRASHQVANGGVQRRRNYTRATWACVRCKKGKFKCDNNPRGCGRCHDAGKVCCDADPHGNGPGLERAAANDLVNYSERQSRHIELLSKQVRGFGGTPVTMPE